MAKFDSNSDGSVIVTLSAPITVGGETLEKVTIPRLRGKHLMGAPTLNSIGMYIELAARIVEPRGAVEEMAPRDAVEVGDHLLVALGKSSEPPPANG